MTVAAGDAITLECYTNGNGYDPSNIIAGDVLNGYYHEVHGSAHSANGKAWVATFVEPDSAGGTVTPFCENWEDAGFGIAAQAWSGARTTGLLDGRLSLFNSATAANPTAGTAVAPAQADAAIICQLVYPAAQSTSAGAGFSPSGTLTGLTNSYAQYFEYQIQTTATAVNCPYTSAGAQFTDSQFALLNASSSEGYHGLTGVFGLPAAAQANGVSVTAAILDSASGSLSPMNPTLGPWIVSGSGATFDTSVAPVGTLKLDVNGITHTLGDARTSILVAAGNTSTDMLYGMKGLSDDGAGVWLGSFVRIGSGQGASQFCDLWNVDGTETEGNETTQIHTDSNDVMYFQLEINQGDTPTGVKLYPSTALNFGQDYYVITHVAGINEANDEIYVLAESPPGTLPWTVIDHLTWPKAGPVQNTTTATAPPGASSITVASAKGIVVGQKVWSAKHEVDSGEIPIPTTVTSVNGTTIGISNATTAAMSSTPVEFTGQVATTTGSVTAGSTTLTVASGTGLVAGPHGTGQLVGMTGVLPGTWLVSGSGTSWTMSQPAKTTESGVTAAFWPPNPGALEFHFGKFSSCTSTANTWFSGFIYDPWGNILPKIANGSLSL